ncbi:hypothetical protein SAMN05216436_115134 [bacterium A37T11]|nr:hypothetical protein SAMN05216436_115134 [bacterium A37T11]
MRFVNDLQNRIADLKMRKMLLILLRNEENSKGFIGY